MNENTCALEKEMRRALLEKLEQNYLDYTVSLQALTSEQLLDRTKEIYAAQVCCRLVQRRMIFPSRRCGTCCRWMTRWQRCGTLGWSCTAATTNRC